MSDFKIVSPAEYKSARLELLAKEKEATRLHDTLAAQRRQLPLVEITKPYTFKTLDNSTNKPKEVSLNDLFSSRRQLIVYHFMFDPSWDGGCSSCSVVGDHIPALEHLNSRSTSFVAVSRAPIDKIAAYKKRMGWTFPWVSSFEGDFNYDFKVTQDDDVVPVEYNFKTKQEMLDKGQPWFTEGEQPGISCFVRGGEGIGEEGKVYHSYSCYARGGEPQVNTFFWLDLTPLGRQDGRTDVPGLGFKKRDEYTADDLKGLPVIAA